MAHFTLPFLAPSGPLLTAFVAPSEGRRRALVEAGQTVPNPLPIRALIDTGASCTCIDPTKLAALNLTPTGSMSVNTPSTGTTPHEAEQFDVTLLIPGEPTGHLIFQTIPVLGAELSVQGIDALIGRDILHECVLVYNGTQGTFTLAF